MPTDVPAMEVDTPLVQPSPELPPFTTKCFSVMGKLFECPDRYRLIRPVGHGAYGVVCAAQDSFTGENVAIKKIAGVIDNLVDCKRTLREMRLLRHFRHENVITIKDVYIPPVHGSFFKDVYTVSELMETDLHQIIISHQGLSGDHCQYFVYQILRALKHIHSANVFHRDLKPSNILLNGNCDLKICDFGLARVVPEPGGNLTAYVATRWYRAPEIMLSWRDYTRAVDIWSVGCILAEMLGGRPLFPGGDYITQLNLVTDIIGTPSATDILSINSEKAQYYVRENLMNRPRKPMLSLFPHADPLLCDLIEQMLVFHPRDRITVEDALKHPYLKSLHDPVDEPRCPAAFNIEFDEDQNPDKDSLCRLIWEEAQQYRRRDEEWFRQLRARGYQFR